eukprot:TRINITY_DN222085_c0_g1_i1.p1 TRINITY_DN222085_c0_g1~~TRINITY_DN222085_c0_g1_i1.p1  ORF type:complete len:214 (+),score=55.21 TRINITY_DN222085_c0_g1_i1:80-643(+)
MDSESVLRVKADLESKGLEPKLFMAEPGYYDRTLEERANMLECETSQLCKTIVMKNTKCVNKHCDDKTNSQYYMVIVQYITKLNAEKLFREVRGLKPEGDRPGRKKYNFQFASAAVAQEMTGFGFNAVCPFGSIKDIPLVISKQVAELDSIWLGGGHELVKVNVNIEDLKKNAEPFILDIAEARDDL